MSLCLLTCAQPLDHPPATCPNERSEEHSEEGLAASDARNYMLPLVNLDENILARCMSTLTLIDLPKARASH